MMDIRVNVDFFQHPKTIKLQRRLGLGGVTALLQLWMWAAKNRPDGELRDMDEEDIEIAAGWRSDLTSDPDRDRGFAATLADLRWLDIQQKGSRTIYSLHDWAEHNPWAAETTTRSDWARLLKMACYRFTAYYSVLTKSCKILTVILIKFYMHTISAYIYIINISAIISIFLL